jgi:hypothetical protein
MDFKNEFIIELMECILSGADELQVKHMLDKETQNLQLQQTGVKSSVLIEFKEWDYTCGDGCCTSFGTKLLLNGKELEHPNEEIKDNSYVGDDTQTAIHAILKELGYDVKFG